MRLGFLLVAVLLASVRALAQPPIPSSADATTSSTVDGAAPALPVSLDHIREGLAKTEPMRLHLNKNTTADFKSEVLEQAKLNEIIASMDFRGGPVPPGGPYAYEQQRLMFNSVDNPLMQPYAAFNGGELVTIAIESLARSYLGDRAVNAVTTARRNRAEAAAHARVAQAIADYCAAQQNGGAGVLLCTVPPDGSPITP